MLTIISNCNAVKFISERYLLSRGCLLQDDFALFALYFASVISCANFGFFFHNSYFFSIIYLVTLWTFFFILYQILSFPTFSVGLDFQLSLLNRYRSYCPVPWHRFYSILRRVLWNTRAGISCGRNDRNSFSLIASCQWQFARRNMTRRMYLIQNIISPNAYDILIESLSISTFSARPRPETCPSRHLTYSHLCTSRDTKVICLIRINAICIKYLFIY